MTDVTNNSHIELFVAKTWTILTFTNRALAILKSRKFAWWTWRVKFKNECWIDVAPFSYKETVIKIIEGNCLSYPLARGPLRAF